VGELEATFRRMADLDRAEDCEKHHSAGDPEPRGGGPLRVRERAVPERYFTTRTLTPFAVYCLVAGVASLIRFA
jgi:hypothetical protein